MFLITLLNKYLKKSTYNKDLKLRGSLIVVKKTNKAVSTNKKVINNPKKAK